jgi:hypothetical protein
MRAYLFALMGKFLQPQERIRLSPLFLCPKIRKTEMADYYIPFCFHDKWSTEQQTVFRKLLVAAAGLLKNRGKEQAPSKQTGELLPTKSRRIEGTKI